jgi:hypothetical protein
MTASETIVDEPAPDSARRRAWRAVGWIGLALVVVLLVIVFTRSDATPAPALETPAP